MDGSGPDIEPHGAPSRQDWADRDWYLVQVRPGGLARAIVNLQRQAFEVFAPKRLETRRRGGRLVTRECLLFPGYVFVALDLDRQGWSAIRSTYGVRRLVSLDGRMPTKVPHGVMAELLAADETGQWAGRIEVLQPGKSVGITVGPFAGCVAKIIAAPEQARVLVLLSMMGREVMARVPVRAVV